MSEVEGQPPCVDRVSVHTLCREGNDSDLSAFLDAQEDKSLCTFHAVLTAPDDDGMHPLHVALLNANPACVQTLLEAGADPNFGYDGNPPLHLALALGQFADYRSDCLEAVKSLLQCEGIEVNAQDRLGRTALHLAASCDWLEAGELLLAAKVSPDVLTFAGRSALCTAIEHRSAACVRLLANHAEALQHSDASGDCPAHLAVRSAAWECLAVIAAADPEALQKTNGRGQSPEALALACGFAQKFAEVKDGKVPTAQSKQTLIVSHPLCKEHAALPAELQTNQSALSKQRKMQAENPTRLQVLLESPHGALLVDEFVDNLLWVTNPPPANVGDVLRVHDYSYIHEVSSLCSSLEDDQVPFKYDKDTWLTKQSFPAALQAAGAVLAAVDEVVEGRYRNAFCCIRPPGHHIGVFGAVDSDTEPNISSSGFCLLNNVAIGASYALAIRRALISRVAIIDFDVHHGNGTEEIVRNLQPSQKVVKQHSYMWKCHIEITSYKPWLDSSDPQNVLFVSSHGFGMGFYPASGAQSGPSELYPAGILNLPFPQGTDSHAFRTAYRTHVFPRLMAFQPDLIFISAGFDGHELDAINHGFLRIDEEDYRWVTEELIKVANACCDGRIVSVLEGGYRVKGGIVSALAQSVAAHVRALMNANGETYVGANQGELEEEERRMTLKRKAEADSMRRSLRKRPRRTIEESATADLLQTPDDSESS